MLNVFLFANNNSQPFNNYISRRSMIKKIKEHKFEKHQKIIEGKCF